MNHEQQILDAVIRIEGEVGGLRSDVKTNFKRGDDHETRIRHLEKPIPWKKTAWGAFIVTIAGIIGVNL